jgi:hypothetical protein
LKAGTGRADSSAHEHAEQVCPAYSAVAAVRQESAHLIGARNLVVDLGYRGVDLERRRHHLFVNALMQPKDLPSISRNRTG